MMTVLNKLHIKFFLSLAFLTLFKGFVSAAENAPSERLDNKSHSTQPTSKNYSLLPSDEDSPDFSQTPIDETKVKAVGGIIIEGDRLDIYLDKTFTALGNGVLDKQDQHIEADRLEYDTQNKTIHAVGNTKIKTPDTYATGDELHLNLDDTIGQMTKVKFTLKQAATPGIPLTAFNQASVRQVDLIGDDPLSNMVANPNQVPAKAKTAKKSNEQSRGDADVLFFEGEGKNALCNQNLPPVKLVKTIGLLNHQRLSLTITLKRLRQRMPRLSLRAFLFFTHLA